MVSGSFQQCHGDDQRVSLERSLLNFLGFREQSGNRCHSFFGQMSWSARRGGLLDLWGASLKSVTTWGLLKSGEKSCASQNCLRGDGVLVAWWRGGADCTHPVDHIPLAVHHSHDRSVYYVCLWRSDSHFHDVVSDQSGPPVVFQTSQSLLGLNDMLFEKPINKLSVSCCLMWSSMQNDALRGKHAPRSRAMQI